MNEIYQWLTSKHTLYIRLFKDRVEIKHLEGGKSLVRLSHQPYSNNRLIIADYEAAEVFLIGVIKELLYPPNLFFDKGLRIILQPVDSEITEISSSESRIYRDFAQQIGAREVYLCSHQEIMTDDEILKFIG
ncbi:hypothetical protein [Brumimicrobium mesophilum]|uniref:hypothetical protein n=1 Tax=Brumimicrobium mesophilum TaxID=392717 RepID=UPI00131BC5B3|nr:hypothetical protein [Brumimicrobium mesophilum]